MAEDITSEEQDAIIADAIAQAAEEGPVGAVGEGVTGPEGIPDSSPLEVTSETGSEDPGAGLFDDDDIRPINTKLRSHPGYLAIENGKVMGDKDPEVVQWCRDHLSPSEFGEKYDGRKVG